MTCSSSIEVADILLQRPLVHLVDRLHRDDLDVRRGPVRGAEVEHLLGLRVPPIVEPARLLRAGIRLNAATGRGCSGAPTSTGVPSTSASRGRRRGSCWETVSSAAD